MKIAVIGTYPPQRDGIGIYSKRYVEALQKRDQDVRVFTFKGNENGKEVEGCLRRNNVFSYIRTAFKLHAFKPEKVLIQYEYVHYNVAFFPMLLFLLWVLGHKINMFMHTVAPYEKGWKALIFRMVHLSLFLFAHHVILHTKIAKNKLLERTWVKPYISYLPIAIKDQHVKPRLSKSTAKLLSFGFISYDKGIDLLCEAVKGLQGVSLTICGSVSPYAMKKQKIYAEKIGKICEGRKNITYIDRFVSDQEKEDLFRSADFVVLPYRFIEQSAVLTEVWGYKKIPICSDVAAFKQELADKYGILFSNEDSGDLRNKITALLKNKGRQKQLLSHIEMLVKKRNFEASAEKLLRLLL
ncbi:MAG: glycosyltransferase [Candidatus Woesearchaeota archaeon]|jgi:glycosyltransferase involved in cell wall biosynthesis|nr:glycosyltransferase [Candidatus Woesearchaeota archaeon]MDP7323917.1 glycosyltransferase [Candidatus Woesearchaeota archaeon]MDP7458287.1 glycosyltransferase [Candidatus Woesearchaeota archaeon]